MIRVLQNLPSLDGGGIAKLLFDYYREIDHEKIHFDFLIYDYYSEGIYEAPLKAMGCKIYKVPPIEKDKNGSLSKTEEIIRNGNFDVVHSHFGRLSYRILKYAKKYNVPVRIAHSHIAYEPMKLKTKLTVGLRSSLTKHYATQLMACGMDAGIYMWGKTAVEHDRVIIMKNAIDTRIFRFSPDVREEKRKELGLSGKYVIGIVGRLSDQKNYPFLLRTMKLVAEKRKDAVLVVVGRGLEEKEKEIKELSEKMNLGEHIRFLGIRSDVQELLNAMDVFVLPSLYEGLPVVLIEAQANGIREFVSNTVTKEMDITDLITFLPIEDTEQLWADKIIAYSAELSHRQEYADRVREAGYDVKAQSKKLEAYYIS